MLGNLTFRTSAIVGITLLALVLGGSTELWAQSVIVLLGALLMLYAPPRLALGATPFLIIVFLLALALCAFLPSWPTFMPHWWQHLALDLHASLGPFRTPQPWLTLQSVGLLFFGLVWTYYLFAQEWTPAEKSQALRLFVFGIILLAAVTIITYVTGYRIPGWTQEQNRGWFPNRNQTGDVLALGGIINYVVAFKSLQKKEWAEGFWLVGFALISIALVITYSRAGIMMFFIGIGSWHILSLFQAREGKSIKHTAIGLASLLILLSLFLLFGGATLARFLKVSGAENPSTWDYRMLIQEDTVRGSFQSPLLGIGLGNFESVFASMRNLSADQNRALHPESDWMWLVLEMGWLAPIILIAGLWWWLSQCLPFVKRSGEALRRAALIAVVLFIIHGFVDVSGHRVGSILVGTLLASLALSPAKKRAMIYPWLSSTFRAIALILVLFGSWWMASFAWNIGPPTSITLARLQGQINQAATDGRLASVSQMANAALEIDPLDWTSYFRRGTAEAFRTGGAQQAANDFQIARFLEPHWIDLCANEGIVWLNAGDSAHCINAWTEALRRSGNNGVILYGRILGLAQNTPEVFQGLQSLAAQRIDYLITFLYYANPEQAKAELNGLLSRDATLHTLNSEQQKKLFAAWYARGNQDDLALLLQEHEELQNAGWAYLALHSASQNDFAMACAIAMRYLPRPNMPQIPPNKPLATLENNFNDHPEDIVEGVMLCQAQIQSKQTDQALNTVDSLLKLKNCPLYVYYLKAELSMQKQDWEEAWNALLKFGII